MSKPERNGPCECGSGKKFKKCCGDTKQQPAYIFESPVNAFYYLKQDADMLTHLAERAEKAKDFSGTRHARTAVVLYAIATEALANFAFVHHCAGAWKSIAQDRLDKLSIEDKIRMVPLIAAEGKREPIDTGAYPWSHWLELIKLRNDFVHPKPDRKAYYRWKGRQNFEPLSYLDLPPDLDISVKHLLYSQTRIPKDPYSLRAEHARTARKLVEDIVKGLDVCLGGALSKDGCLESDTFHLIYPPGGTLSDPIFLKP